MTTIRIAAIVDDPADIDIGPQRVFDAICEDERFDFSAIIQSQSGARAGSAIYRFATAIDARLFARARKVETPNFEVRRNALAVYDASAFAGGEKSLDVLLDFSASGEATALAECASFGLWRLTSYQPYAGFFETRSPVAKVDLFRTADRQSLPRRIASANYTVKFSAARTGAFLREKSVQLLIRELKRLAEEGVPADDGPLERPPARAPRNGDLAAYGIHLARNIGARIIEQVAIRARFRPGMFVLKHGAGGPLDFNPADGTHIAPTGNTYWADPFLFEHDGEMYAFFEDYDYASGRGHIGVGIFSDKNFFHIGPAITADYHLSFPYIFRHDREIYMIPETSQSRRLEIWRCVAFPDQWDLHATALDGTATADSALFQRDGACWLWTNITSDSYGDHCTELHLYRASDIALRDLEPHPLNPVVIDARTARGGGRVFEDNGALYRVSQDNAFGTYGYGVNIMEITRLDMRGYSERLARHIAPNFEHGLIGCHHADFAKGRYIIDVRRRYGGFVGA